MIDLDRMEVHVLKLWPEYFEAVASGAKTVELRREDDRHFAVGDVLVLREYRPALEEMADALKDPDLPYGRSVTVHVTHVLRDPDGRWHQPGVVALSIRLEEPGDAPLATPAGKGVKR